jgi:hypothetical protein
MFYAGSVGVFYTHQVWMSQSVYIFLIKYVSISYLDKLIFDCKDIGWVDMYHLRMFPALILQSIFLFSIETWGKMLQALGAWFIPFSWYDNLFFAIWFLS